MFMITLLKQFTYSQWNNDKNCKYDKAYSNRCKVQEKILREDDLVCFTMGMKFGKH